MFPNVQWLFAAMLTSILLLSGGFGLFASLRVMHEPLTHLPPGAGPAQSFADNTEVPATPLIVAPFETRFPAESRPVVQVGADLQALRIDRSETTAPIDPPPAQHEVAPETVAQAQPAEVSDGAKALDPVAIRPAVEPNPDAATSEISTGQLSVAQVSTAQAPTPEVAAVEIPAPDTIKAIDPSEIVPLPRAAPPPKPAKASAKAKPRPRAVAKSAVHQRVAARTRHPRRSRANADAMAATQPVFPSQPFPDHLFQNPAPAAQDSRSRRRGGGAAMGGPFVAPTAIDPY